MQCAYHPDREPVGACVSCGKLICMECKAALGGKMYCTPCADKIFIPSKSETPSERTGTTSPRQQEAQPAYVAATKPEPIISASSNNSGQGAASVLPDELKGWNWGAFFLTWIWGIGNSVWIAFISFVLGIIWSIVLGIKGTEWAWQHKKWNSIEHFKKTQRTWAKWGVALFIFGIIISVAWIIIALVFSGYSVKLG
jgi:hypothetical protein